jgi:cysteine desulfurase/selenocysteine lyase
MSFLPSSLRNDFPALAQVSPSGRPLVYLDSAATALRPRPVIEAVTDAMSRYASGVHRSVHSLGDEATERYEGARRTVARWVGAQEHEILFTRNTTESLNFGARGWARRGPALVSLSEHHSCLLCWGNENVVAVPPLPNGTPDAEAIYRRLSVGDIGLVAASQVSNVTGYRWDLPRLAAAAHASGAIPVVDAAQSAPHGPLRVEELDCDFLAFSGHKLGSPSGVGVLYGKANRLAGLVPSWRGGGSVEQVHGVSTEPRAVPWRFEAGTPALEAVVGLDAAIQYLWDVGADALGEHQRALRQLAIDRLRSMKTVRLLGDPSVESDGPVSFAIPNQSPHMLARALSDAYGICVRSGFHCAQPLHECTGFPATLRLSFYAYNQPEEIDVFCDAFERLLAASPR